MIRRALISAPLATVAAMALADGAQAKLSRLVAPAAACAHQGEADAPIRAQERTMRCLTNYARRRAHRSRLTSSATLDRSAKMKSRDIVRCDSFSHSACGREFTYWMLRVGYISSGCWRVGENIAWGSGSYGTPRSIFLAWMHSPAHRANILRPSFDRLGIGLRVGTLASYSRAHVWTQHFGEHC